MIRFEYECAGEGCGFASDDMQEALDHCDAGANTLYICANCDKRHGWEINAQACCAKWESIGERPRISSASELALRAENERIDRIATDYYERLTGEAQEEIARLQSGIAALREQWQARYDAWKVEFDEEMQKAGRAERSLILAGQRYAMACVLEELDALFPPEAINEEKAP